jgi:hypothetical protein
MASAGSVGRTINLLSGLGAVPHATAPVPVPVPVPVSLPVVLLRGPSWLYCRALQLATFTAAVRNFKTNRNRR